MQHAQIWPITAENRHGRLMIAGCDLGQLARQYGTPLYCLDAATIRSTCRAYQAAFAQAFPGQTSVHYAGKALLNTGLARLLVAEGLGLDVVSGGELFVALRAGANPGMLHMHGNAKPLVELQEALDAGVGQIVVDNLDELDQLVALTRHRTKPQPIALRITPEIAPDTHQHIQTGQATSKFGLPLAVLDQVGAILADTPGLQLISLHVHLGSQIFDDQVYAQAIAVLLDCAARLRDQHGILVQEINPGGGLGVPYLPDQQLPSIEGYARTIANAMVSGCAARGLALLNLAIEPGRSIIARAGIALYSVIGRKQLPIHGDHPSGASSYLHVDGGMGDNIRPSLYQARYTAVLPERLDTPASECVHVAGRYCESGDVLLHDVWLPPARPGDLLAIAVSGAYTLSMASNYNLTLRPAVLMLEDDQAHLIQRRETYDDLVVRDTL